MDNISVEQLSVNGNKIYPKVSTSSIVDTPEGGFAIQGDNHDATNTEIDRKLSALSTKVGEIQAAIGYAENEINNL